MLFLGALGGLLELSPPIQSVLGTILAGKWLPYLDIRACSPSNQVLHLSVHGGDNAGLDGNYQLLLIPAVLEDDSKGILDLALYATLPAEEAGHGFRSPEENHRLIDGM